MCVYSLDFVPNSAGDLPGIVALDSVLSEHLAKRRRTGESTAKVRLVPDVDDFVLAAEPEPLASSTVYFKVLHAMPSRMKTVKIPMGAGRRLLADEV